MNTLPLEMMDHIGSFLPLKDLLTLCIVHPDMNALVHHPVGRKVYAERYTIRKVIIDEDYVSQGWFYNGQRHREHDLPAVVNSHGTLEWWYHGQRHRDPKNDLPAIKYQGGAQMWYYQGKLHRENGRPAVIMGSGDEEWWQHGVYICGTYGSRTRMA